MSNSQRFWRGLFFIFMITALCTGLALPAFEDSPARAAPQRQIVTHAVISQVYGGGGTNGALYQNDFVEIFNPSDGTLLLDGWSIQFARSNNSDLFDNNVVTLSGTLNPGQYHLVQLNSSGTVGRPLPAPDTTGSIDLGTGNGKVILVNTTAGLPCNGETTPCDPADAANIIDLVGYGTVNFYEGSAVAPKINSKTANLRKKNGCLDDNDNATDFGARAPDPRNTTDPILSCSDRFATNTAAANATGTALDNKRTATASAEQATRTSRALTRTATAVFMNVIINEVAWGGTTVPNTGSADEWIELYNPDRDPINITGWTLQGRDGSPMITLSGTIPGRGFFLLERGDDTVVGDVAANQIWTGAQQGIENSNESLELLDAGGRLVDTAKAYKGDWPAGSGASTYYSMERISSTVADSPTAWMTNNNSSSWKKHDSRIVTTPTCTTSCLVRGTPGYANWAISVKPTPSRTPTRTRTPTRQPTAAPPPPLVAINELVPRPGHDWNLDGVINTGDEYIELLNHGVVDVNLSGYRLDDEANIGSEPYSLPSVIIKPGERIVFYGKDTGLLLSDGGDGVRLLKSNGQLADAYNYFVVRFPDQSYCRLPDNGGLDDWNQNCFPTPGLQNSLSGSVVNPPTSGDADQLCPIADTLPEDFLYAECPPFGNLWNREYWDRFGWFDEKYIPASSGKWPLFAD